ncbi:hypothetical protein MHLP_02020 [Candidatus Mycoplasma haematolamae str. Purdue]|uniref:asparaginase n=1 Tax=Mycoplasma haematolamae (strain Purdue) TaxID=1212765 RepID=I7CJG4_MYCHA|nr:hypothetical protein [Candidatus Mycoplasma haematolamae]AFO51984.1 hypothetical protein MHLP_02020 [Candidatus Mycoplasma haematolamae str. Purdue]
MVLISPKIALLSLAGTGGTVGGGFGTYYVVTNHWPSGKRTVKGNEGSPLDNRGETVSENNSFEESSEPAPTVTASESDLSDPVVDDEDGTEEEPLQNVSGKIFFIGEEGSFGSRDTKDYRFEVDFSGSTDSLNNQLFEVIFDSKTEQRRARKLLDDLNGEILMELWGVEDIIPNLEKKSSDFTSVFGQSTFEELKTKLRNAVVT